MSKINYEIYNELKSRSEKGLWTSVQYLADLINVSKREIRKKIKKIREDITIQKIILTDYHKGYKLMTDDEEFEFLTREKIKILKQFKRYWLNVERYNHNNQNKITVSEHERNLYVSLLKKEVE